MNKCLLFFLFVLFQTTFAQPVVTWQKSYGGSNYDMSFGIREVPGNGYITVGYTASTDGDVTENHGMSDIWVVKLDSDGTIQWQKSYGGSFFEEGYDIELTDDGGYVIAGTSDSADGDVMENQGANDAWIFKIDATGNLLWSHTYGGTSADRAYKIRKTTDGGFIVGAVSSSVNGDLQNPYGMSDSNCINSTVTASLPGA